MLFRDDGEAVIAIAQPSHSWVSGQMCRLWGRDGFSRPEPFADVCLAAEQHDIGWLSWELEPVLEPATRRPQTFMQVPYTQHTRLWRDGVRRMALYSRYAALLVSKHADTIYSRVFDASKASRENAEAVRVFLDEQHAFQAATIAALSRDPNYAGQTEPAVLERNRLTVAALDWISLNLCWGVTQEVRVPEVPNGADRVDLVLRPSGSPDHVVLHPWPFAEDGFAVRFEGGRLEERFDDEAAMRRALAAAERVSVSVVLLRG